MTRDQFICEMMGKCWHEWEVAFPDGNVQDYSMRGHRCVKCKEYWPVKPTRSGPITLPDFLYDADDILALQQFVLEAEWWKDFFWFAAYKYYDEYKPCITTAEILSKWLFSDPDRFATLVAEYRGWQHGSRKI
jgi:hypothetical protein